MPIRRAAVAAFAVAIAAWILRPSLAAALVVRGDEQLYRAQPSLALGYYARALRIDPGNSVAVDRFLFVALSLRRPTAIDAGIDFASEYLRTIDDDTVRFDRALAYRVRGSAAKALADFERIGTHRQDATALTFAGLLAEKLNRRAVAIALLNQALAVSPHWFPAERALQRLVTQR
jgi:tetratricopeptide (TPR) repeat protein